MEPENDKTQSYTPIPKGTVISRYRIVQVIGVGGMGEVHLAEDTELERNVALKFMPQQFLFSSDARARFKREAQAAAALSHPNIIHIYEVSEYQGRPFFAMEYVAGQSLGDLIKAKELGLDRIIDLATQICKGLQKAHEAGITHRDVKPSNIVVDADGQPKLLDFGLAAVPSTEKLTKTGSTLGTIGYMSPEQIQVKDIDQRSDLFSFGVVLYEMITGRLPFKGDTEAATLNSVLHDIPEPLSRYKSGVSGELQSMVSKLLEKDPELRYQSAAGVVSDLKRLSVDVVSVEEKPPKDWWNRYVVVAAVIVIVVLAGYWILTRNGQQPVETVEPERKMLAVLPFENLGDPGDEYFADGITDEITSRLAAVHGLGVISRTSAYAYKNTEKTLPQVGRELDVDYILEGTIRWDKTGEASMVRVTPQLIKVDGDVHLWAGRYDEVLTSVFAVQSQIASQIVSILDIQLAPAEESQVADVPTTNMEAYAHYLKALDYQLHEPDQISARISHLSQAIELDSSFAVAYAELSFAMSEYHLRVNMTARTDTLANAKEFAEKAIELSPDQPHGYRALGQYSYWVDWDFANAEKYFAKALERAPNDAKVLWSLGLLARRTGKWTAAMSHFERAHELDPTTFEEEYLYTALMLRKTKLAQQLVENWILFSPENYDLKMYRARIQGIISNDLDEFAEAVPADAESHLQYEGVRYQLLDLRLMQRDYETSMRIAKASLDYAKTGYEKALLFLHIAEIESQMGGALVSAYADSAVSALNVLRSQNIVRMMDIIAASMLAIAYAQKGDTLTVNDLVNFALSEDPYQHDATNAPLVLYSSSLALAKIGEDDRAIELLETRLSMPGNVYPLELKFMPWYDSLRDNPRFQALFEKYEKEHGN